MRTHHVTHMTENLSAVLLPLLTRIFKRDLYHRSRTQRNFKFQLHACLGAACVHSQPSDWTPAPAGLSHLSSVGSANSLDCDSGTFSGSESCLMWQLTAPHVQPGAVKLVLCGHWMHQNYMHPVTSENQFHCTVPGCMAARSSAGGADRADTFVVAQRDNNAVVVVPSIFAGARTSCNQEANFSDWRISARTLDSPLIAQLLLLLCVFRKLSLLIRESENQGRRPEPCTNAIHHKANRKRVANLLAFSLSIHSRVGLDRVQLSLGNWTGGPTSSIRHDQSQPLQIIRVIDRSEVRRIPEEIAMKHSA